MRGLFVSGHGGFVVQIRQLWHLGVRLDAALLDVVEGWPGGGLFVSGHGEFVVQIRQLWHLRVRLDAALFDVFEGWPGVAKLVRLHVLPRGGHDLSNATVASQGERWDQT